jgi:serine O-acetyltransferase
MNPVIMIYRIGHWCHTRGLKRIGWAFSWVCRFLFATWVPSSAKIGRNVKLGYWGLGVVIHKNASVGDNCHIDQHVTIGRNPGQEGVPRIGNMVYIGAGAVVSGDIVVGDRAVIGANSVVLSDVPELALVVGAPARVARILSLDEHYRVLNH